VERGTQHGPDLRERLIAFAALAGAVLSGLLLFHLSAAPLSYVIVNAAALAIAFALIVPGNPVRSRLVAPVVTICAIAVLLAAAGLGPDVDGVRRWIAAGPIRLHAGMLVIPALVAVLPRQRESVSLIVTGIVAAVAWAQPDFATALALFAGVSIASPSLVLRLVTLSGLLLTALRPDHLPPVPLVETAVQDGWALSPLLGGLLVLSLALAVAVPAIWLTNGNAELQNSRRAVIAAMTAFALAPVLGAFPQPLIGYGASAILGYGFALAALRFTR
jgi:hypothetical protein